MGDVVYPTCWDDKPEAPPTPSVLWSVSKCLAVPAVNIDGTVNWVAASNIPFGQATIVDEDSPDSVLTGMLIGGIACSIDVRDLSIGSLGPNNMFINRKKDNKPLFLLQRIFQ